MLVRSETGGPACTSGWLLPVDSRDPGPYVLFMGFPSPHDPALLAWLGLRERVAVEAGAPQMPEFAAPSAPAAPNSARPPDAADEWIGIWRLLAPNNREIGRSAFIYGSFEVAQANVTFLKHSAAELTPVSFHGPTGGMHGWYVTLEGRLVFTCSRWYETGQLSLEAAAGAIQAMSAAFVSHGPHQFSGRRRTRPSALSSR